MSNNISTYSLEKLTITGVGINNKSQYCFKNELLSQLKKSINITSIGNEIPKESDVYLVNLDKDTLPLLQKQTFSDNSFVIFIVHDFTRETISFLKYADHLIFINELQQYLCIDFLNFDDYSYSVLPYPFGSELTTTNTEQKKCLLNIEGPLSIIPDEAIQHAVDNLLNWFPENNYDSINIFFEVDHNQTERFEKFSARFKEIDKRVQVYNILDTNKKTLYEVLTSCVQGQFVYYELTLEEYVDSLQKNDPWVIQESLKESPIKAIIDNLSLMEIPLNGKSFFNSVNEQKGDWEQWENELKNIILSNYNTVIANKTSAVKAIKIDTKDDLNIIKGAPLSNDFVFSVCFRNQEEKIERCLESLITQTGGFDFGIAIVSDQSTDNSVEKIINYLNKHNIDCCVVDNKEHRFAARNFYNVAHSLTTNDESVIIEVDGDDFLSSPNVLSILDQYYKNGALKTNGSFKMYPEDQNFYQTTDTENHHKNFDTTKPWSLSKCTSWLHLRTSKRHLITSIEVDYFLERKSKKWLTDRHDSIIHSKLIELAGDKTAFINEILYCYDVSGDNHDHEGDDNGKEILRTYKKIDKMFYPLTLEL